MENLKVSKYSSEATKTVSEILSCFNNEYIEIGITQIAQKLGMYPSKVHRVVSSLEKFRFLEKNPITKKYRVGLRLFEIGNLYLLNLSLRRIVHPHALELAKIFETNVNLGILSKSIPYSVLIVDRVINIESDNATVQRISLNVPIHSSSLGKILLAFSEERFARAILQNIELQKYTSSTIIDRRRLEEELRLVRNQGYAIDRAETHPNLSCIGAPLRDKNGVVAAISISDIRPKIEQKQDEIIKKIISTADFISYQIGY